MADNKKQFDFNKITLEDMVNFVVNNNLKDKINLKQFLEEKEKYKLVNVNDAEGKPKTYIGKNGKVKIKKKQIPTGEKVERYNFLKAKRYFYNETKSLIDWKNPPKERKTKDNKKASDILSKLD